MHCGNQTIFGNKISGDVHEKTYEYRFMETLKTLRKIPILNRKKIDPGKFIFTGNVPNEEIAVQLFKYNKVDCIESKIETPSSIEEFQSDKYHYWLNIYGLSDVDAITSICSRYNIHDLAIQDILDVNQRPKYQEYDDYSFLTLKSIVPSNNELITEQISFILGKNFLISFQERKADFFEHLRYRLREDKGAIREKGSDYLLYGMLESILDNYFKTLTQLDDDIENLNLTDSTKELLPSTLVMIENHKKYVHFIKKSILPIKDFSQIIERQENKYIEKKNLKYFLEIKDLCLTLVDSCDILQSSLESSTNLFFSVQGHRMNQIMKILTIVASIFIPLTFITGIYGMNFYNMPEIHWKYGYAAIWLLIIIIFSWMLFYLKKRKWF
jgi:magnesium transporter